MKLKCEWNSKMLFTATTGDLKVKMDASAPIGDGSEMTPKHLLLSAICGCTAMDVVALMRKHKQNLSSFWIDAETEMTQGKHPAVFKEVKLYFRAKGEVEPAKLLEAVKLSQTQYCGVSAMVAAAVPIQYEVELNGEKIGSGQAEFQLS